MKASRSLWFTAPRQISFRESVLASVRDGEVEIRTLFSGISHGTEMLVYRGQVSQDLETDPTIGSIEGSFGFPIKYGYASVGEVVDMGPGVGDLRKGDIVFAYHPHETGYVMPGSQALKLPAELPPQLGIFVANLETALNCILDADIKIGESVVIFGQGVVGLLITQLAQRCGAARILTVDKIEARRALSLRMGAVASFDPARDDLFQAIREHTDGVGADVAIEASGSPEALNDAIRTAAFEGTVVVVSWYGTKPATLYLGDEFHRNRIRIRSSQVSYLAPALTPRWSINRRRSFVLQLLSGLNLAELISHIYPFAEAHQAYERIDKSPEEVLQVVLEYV